MLIQRHRLRLLESRLARRGIRALKFEAWVKLAAGQKAIDSAGASIRKENTAFGIDSEPLEAGVFVLPSGAPQALRAAWRFDRAEGQWNRSLRSHFAPGIEYLDALITLIDHVNETTIIDRDSLHLVVDVEAPDSRGQAVAKFSRTRSLAADDLNRLGLIL